MGDGFAMNQDHSILTVNGTSKTISYDPMNNLPLLCTESGLTRYTELNDLMQHVGLDENLTFAQRHLLHWHRRLAHMDFEKLKDFARKGFLPKEIENCEKNSLPILCTSQTEPHFSFSSSHRWFN